MLSSSVLKVSPCAGNCHNLDVPTGICNLLGYAMSDKSGAHLPWNFRVGCPRLRRTLHILVDCISR